MSSTPSEKHSPLLSPQEQILALLNAANPSALSSTTGTTSQLALFFNRFIFFGASCLQALVYAASVFSCSDS